MQIWIYIWTGLWFTSLVVFSFLSALIIVFGAIDLIVLLRSLKSGQQEQETIKASYQPSQEKTAS